MLTAREEREFYEMSLRYDKYLEQVDNEDECMSFEEFEEFYLQQVEAMLEANAQEMYEDKYA